LQPTSMPPLQVMSNCHDSPTHGPSRTRQRRSSAIVPLGVLHSAKLGLVEPELEEPEGTCVYAHNSVLTIDEKTVLLLQKHQANHPRVSLQSNDSSSSPRVGGGRRTSRARGGVGGAGGVGQRGRRSLSSSASNKMESQSAFAWMGCAHAPCTDTPCIVS
jgi:hypothetical protein